MVEVKKLNFERKLTPSGKPNVKYVDLLKDEDEPIAGQSFVCVSIVSPEQIIKKKEIYFFEQFLKNWEFNKSIDKYIQFLNYISFKYNISFDNLKNDLDSFINEEKENIMKSNVYDEYKTFIDNNETELEKQFNIAHNFQTNTRGIKIRGSFSTQDEAREKILQLSAEEGNKHNIFLGYVGKWMPIDVEAYKTGEVQYLEEELNQLMHEKEKNEQKAKLMFDNRVKEAKQKAIEENIKNAEKSGNSLTQTIDNQGNLIGVNNLNSQEFVLKQHETISTSDICKELFEGDNIVIDKTDNGKSLLKSPLFGNLNN